MAFGHGPNHRHAQTSRSEDFMWGLSGSSHRLVIVSQKKVELSTQKALGLRT